MLYRITLTLEGVEDHAMAAQLLSDMEEVAGKANTSLFDSELECLDEEE